MPMNRITYLLDPLCGWCYGASPALEGLVGESELALTLAPTGLFAGENARPLNAQFAAYAWENDQRITRLTGQPFSEEYRLKVLNGPGRRFDSGPATLALTAVHLTEPEREFEALKAIQLARYVEGRDNTDIRVVAEVLRRLGLAAAAERILTPDADLLKVQLQRVEAARADMRRFGIEGVPALIVGEGEERSLVRGSVLYGGVDFLRAAVSSRGPR